MENKGLSTKLHAYLNFNGNCEEAFRFYEVIFQSTNMGLHRYSDLPESPDFKISEEDKSKIMHTSILINNDVMLMGSDTIEAFGQKATHGSGTYLMLDTANAVEAKRLYNTLSESAQKIEMPLSEQFYAELYAMLIDKFGVAWIIHFAGKKANH